MSYPLSRTPLFDAMTRLALGALVVLAPGFSPSARAAPHVQTDWSGGPVASAPVTEWTSTFESSAHASWRSIEGQLALTSIPAVPSGGIVTGEAPSCRDVAAGDLDGDGDEDLMTALALTSFPGTGKVRWYENAGDGATWTEHEIDDDFYGGSAITCVDIDGDDDLDVVASAFYGTPQEDGRYAWYENSDGAAGSWTKHPIAGNLWGTQMVATADIDGDGDPDVYGSSTLTYIGNFNDDIYWFENVDGAGGSWVQHAIDDDFADAIEAVAADFDADGDLDVAGVAYGTHDLAWWENSGGNGLVWIKHPISDFTLVDNALAVDDVDDDGDPDIVAVGQNSTVCGWYENVGGVGADWSTHTVGSLVKGTDVQIMDLDGDGNLDVLAAGTDLSSSQVVWFRNLGRAAGWTTLLVSQGHDSGMAAISADLDGDGAREVVYTEEGSFAGDLSGLHRRNITAFLSSGQLESAVLDGGGPTDWESIDWAASVPSGTSVAFQVRSSNDPDDLGPWSAELSTPTALAGILDPATRYAQYRVLLSSSNSATSARVFEVALEASHPTGAQDAASFTPTAISLAIPRPNPTASTSAVAFTIPVAGPVRLDVLDVRGRLVATPLAASLVAGTHEADLPALSPGVYFLRLTSNGQSAAEKLVTH